MDWVINLVTTMKLSTKISTLLVCAVIITGLLIGILTVEATTKSFDQYIFELREVQLGQWGDIYLNYYVKHGNSWAGVEYIRQVPSLYDPFAFFNSSASVVLTDAQGVILAHPEKQNIGLSLASDVMERGFYLNLDGESVGILFPMDYFNPRFWILEENFAHTVAQAAIKGTFFTSLFAILLGLALSQGMVEPLKDLIKAIKRMAQGHFDEPLPIYSSDEIGELSRAFNSMSQEIEKGNTVRRQMFADISHELRTPLTVLASKLEGTLEKNKSLNTVEVAVLYDEVIRLNGLVNELQHLSKLEAGQVSLNKTLINFNGFFEDFLTLLEAEAEDRSISLEVDVAEDLQYCYADPQRLKQIILNLVNNAMRYTPDGGVVRLHAYQDPYYFIFEVSDNGLGISEEDLPYIFQRFYRADKSRDRATGGSGLGLAITQGFVQAHGGTIMVDSVIGEGTKFVVKLPVYQEEEEKPLIPLNHIKKTY